jgi:hypothetical protein
MAADATKEAQFEIGHVVFIDIVRYSKPLMEEQKERLHQLIDIVLAISQVAKKCIAVPLRSGPVFQKLLRRKVGLTHMPVPSSDLKVEIG